MIERERERGGKSERPLKYGQSAMDYSVSLSKVLRLPPSKPDYVVHSKARQR